MERFFSTVKSESGGLRTTRSGRVMFTVGRLVGSCSPATDNDGHATKRPSTFFEHRRSLIQPTRKPTDLTNPSTESDQVQARDLNRVSDHDE